MALEEREEDGGGAEEEVEAETKDGKGETGMLGVGELEEFEGFGFSGAEPHDTMLRNQLISPLLVPLGRGNDGGARRGAFTKRQQSAYQRKAKATIK